MPVQAWFQRFLAACLLLAVGLTSLRGQVIGYRCDCGELPVVVAVSDCHLLECHPDHAHADGCATDTDHPSGGADHSHEHPPVVSELEWSRVETGWSGLTLVAPLPPVVTIASSFELEAGQAPALLPVINFSPPPPRRTFLTSLLLI